MHIFLTGASTGIGRAIAQELDRLYQGNAVFSLVARRQNLLDSLKAALTGTARTYAADLSDPKNADGVLTRAIQENGPVDILINNAGVQHIDHFTKITNETAQQLLNLNYSTPAQLMRQVLPSMVERDTGIVINTASLGAITPTPYMAEYCASKAALAALATALSGEYKDSKIHFITVYPGPIKTPMADYADERYEKGAMDYIPFGTAEGLAKEIRYAVEKKKHKVVYPAFYQSAELVNGLATWITAQMAPKPRG